jgi:hypothetical protein
VFRAAAGVLPLPIIVDRCDILSGMSLPRDEIIPLTRY